MNLRSLASQKRGVIRRIERQVSPKLRPSGFNIKLCHFGFHAPDGPRLGEARTRKLNGFILKEFEGFCEGGLIVDGYSGGMSTVGYEDLPLEDLLKLERVVPSCLQKAS